MKVPTEYQLCDPTVQSLRTLGGTGSIQDIAQNVIHRMRLPDELVRRPHGNSRQTELEYRLAWARTILKTCGLIYNPKRGVWVLTEEGSHQPVIDSAEIRRFYLEHRTISSDTVTEAIAPPPYPSDSTEDDDWNRLTIQQFFAQYADADSIYDDIGR